MHLPVHHSADGGFDFSEADNIDMALQLGLLNYTRDRILEFQKYLKASGDINSYVQTIIHGIPVTEAQAYAFAQVHTAINAGDVFVTALPMQTPGPTAYDQACSIINAQASNDLHLSATTPTTTQDCLLSVVGKITLANLPTQVSPVGLRSREIHFHRCDRQTFALDIGATSATRTFAYLKMGLPIARWMPSSRFIHLLLAAPTFRSYYELPHITPLRARL